MKQLNSNELKDVIVALTVENIELKEQVGFLKQSISMLSTDLKEAEVKLGSVGIEL